MELVKTTASGKLTTRKIECDASLCHMTEYYNSDKCKPSLTTKKMKHASLCLTTLEKYNGFRTNGRNTYTYYQKQIMKNLSLTSTLFFQILPEHCPLLLSAVVKGWALHIHV